MGEAQVKSRWDKWRPAVVVLLGLGALAALLYPSVADWWNDRLHAAALADINAAVVIGPAERLEGIRQEPVAYNQHLLATGDVDMKAYRQQIDPTGSGVMGRVKIPKIGVDIPIFHTSDDDVLRKGAGHLPGTTLPVGGKTTHTAITAHRGLRESRLFTDLDKVEKGDRFTLEVLGEAYVYEVETTRIVAPSETDWLVVQSGRDLATLITCDPLGINTERMLVTGERVTPTPIEDAEAVGAAKVLIAPPGWFWWLLLGLLGVGVASWWSVTPQARSERCVVGRW